MGKSQKKPTWIHVPNGDEPLTGPMAELRERILREAENEGLTPLTDRHWAVILFVLDSYWRTGQVPVAVKIGRATGLGVRELFHLFPSGVAKTIFRLAALEMPPDLPHRKSLSWWN
ncbi:MAG: TusE/DsrC/DsvC family sulfur relay protein [bacterium]